MNNEANTTLEHLIAERAEKVLSELQWHDTLDVQNAVKKAFTFGFNQGYVYANENAKVLVKAEDIDKAVSVKYKKKVNRSGKK